MTHGEKTNPTIVSHQPLRNINSKDAVVFINGFRPESTSDDEVETSYLYDSYYLQNSYRGPDGLSSLVSNIQNLTLKTLQNEALYAVFYAFRNDYNPKNVHIVAHSMGAMGAFYILQLSAKAALLEKQEAEELHPPVPNEREALPSSARNERTESEAIQKEIKDALASVDPSYQERKVCQKGVITNQPIDDSDSSISNIEGFMTFLAGLKNFTFQAPLVSFSPSRVSWVSRLLQCFIDSELATHDLVEKTEEMNADLKQELCDKKITFLHDPEDETTFFKGSQELCNAINEGSPETKNARLIKCPGVLHNGLFLNVPEIQIEARINSSTESDKTQNNTGLIDLLNNYRAQINILSGYVDFIKKGGNLEDIDLDSFLDRVFNMREVLLKQDALNRVKSAKLDHYNQEVNALLARLKETLPNSHTSQVNLLIRQIARSQEQTV